MQLVSINAGRFDATKHSMVAVIGDAKHSLQALDVALGDYAAPKQWLDYAGGERSQWYAFLADNAEGEVEIPTYAQAVRAINEVADDTDYQVVAAGGLVDTFSMGWHSKSVGSVDIEFGYSCMGYEIAGALGAKMAFPDRDVIAWVGDGSYLMMNSEIHSSVATGHKVIIIVCDNGRLCGHQPAPDQHRQRRVQQPVSTYPQGR